MATTDCALVALDAVTGKEVWSVALDDYKTGCYSTLAPLAVPGKIIVGYSGGELGVRGSVSAFDASTGKRIWKTYTVPAPNEPGGDTWKGETYKRGGGSTWITGVYDPASNTTYWGTGNPGPLVTDDRPGHPPPAHTNPCPNSHPPVIKYSAICPPTNIARHNSKH